jgi:hypothetical protein
MQWAQRKNFENEKHPQNYWCERRDSNPHGLPHQILSLIPAFCNLFIPLRLQNVAESYA